MLTVNVEELNYLAKRLDSFDTGEAAQFQAMAHKLELFELKDLINLTFCCQQATVITDFSDLDDVGRDHYMNLHGGSASVDELNKLDGEGTARQLIESGSGTVTPYGVVYDNGMKLEQVYDGRFFPCYYAILTDEISRAWSGMSTRQYKNLKGLKKENLRDNMTTLELVLNMLAEATTTQFSKDRKPTTFQENLEVAKAGGQVAGRTRKDIESQSNTPVISPKNAVQLNQVITDLLEDTTSDIPKKMDDK